MLTIGCGCVHAGEDADVKPALEHYPADTAKEDYYNGGYDSCQQGASRRDVLALIYHIAFSLLYFLDYWVSRV